jgi:hypothetical protein
MTYFYLILSGVVMGLVAAVPIGPVNLICIRRSFAFGPLNGFMSGVGAALGDGVFAAIMGFGLTWVAHLIEGYAPIIELIGGAMLVWFGWRTFIAPPMIRCMEEREGATNLLRAVVSRSPSPIPPPCWPSPPCSPALAGWRVGRAAMSMPVLWWPGWSAVLPAGGWP